MDRTKYINKIALLVANAIKQELYGSALKAELQEGWNFHISKPLALFLLHSGIINDNENGCIMSKEYGQDNNEEEDMWNGVGQDDVDTLMSSEYENFAITI